MGKLVILKLGEGSFDRGFPVTLQIGEDGERATIETIGKLPAAPEIPEHYRHWQLSYRRLGLRSRLEAKSGFVTNVSRIEDCDRMAKSLPDRLNKWFDSQSFRPIREKLLEQLTPSDEVRAILQTEDPEVQRLPWHLWDWFDRYPKAEIALGAPAYERINPPVSPKSGVKILAILGHSEGIDTQADGTLLNQLPNAEVTFLVEPDRATLTDRLWDSQGWDILFFAGHSSSEGSTGQISINPHESLTIAQLKHALKTAISRGLKIAILNSCDGLGLARELTDLHIPQILVMREPVPDRVAQEFLKYFLDAFAQGESFYLAVREAREKLQGLEDRFPCATWLPTICQNPAVVPPTWQELSGKTGDRSSLSHRIQPPRTQVLTKGRNFAIFSTIVTAVVLGFRLLGLLQPFELTAFDHLMQLRPVERPDPRLLVITITEADVQGQDPSQRRGSLSDETLHRLLQKLAILQPRAIGLDLYRDYPVQSDRRDLAQRLQQTESLIATCKVSDGSTDTPGIAPPPEIPTDRLGFSDFVVDPDDRVRRHLLALTPEPTSPCLAYYGFNVQLAFRYLAAEGILPQWRPDGNMQLGSVVFQRLTPRTGGYQSIDTWGHQLLLNYRDPDRVAAQVTLGDLLADRVNPASVRDRIVLIGTTAQSFGDYWHTTEGQMSGVMVQAQMLSQILAAVLDDRPLLWVMPLWAEVIWIWTWSLVGGAMAWRFRSPLPFLGAIVLAQVGLYGCCWLFLVAQSGWLPLLPSTLALLGASSAQLKIKNLS